MPKTFTVCLACKQVNAVSTENTERRTPVCGKCKKELPLHEWVSELSTPDLSLLVKKSPVPVVADFWAPWCGPCRAFAPTFFQAAKSQAGKVVFVKINTETDPLAGEFYGIRGIPTLIIFKNGAEHSRQSGALPLDHFLAWIKSA